MFGTIFFVVGIVLYVGYKGWAGDWSNDWSDIKEQTDELDNLF